MSAPKKTDSKMKIKIEGSRKNGNTRSVREKKDDSIMNTNDSSIVSKRCVSKLYFPDEPDFYEPFVSKYMRRNPLINRGYWLRMHAIEHVVRQFLEENSEKSKVVVNLGCGYDPLPFQFWHRYASISQGATFVDVDYPQLIARKRDRILTNELLRDALLKTNLRPAQSPVHLRSDHYLALGCDLRDLSTLESILKTNFNVSTCSFLFLAEVSLTYMPVPDADALIRWGNTLADARFCLLEQYLPQGPAHPFARTMLRHFDKLQTPIQAVKQYPSLTQQTSRFTHAGWSNIKIARNLWDLWSDEAFTPPSVRCRLDAVEPFDEWEEFALFSGHYFLLLASNAAPEDPIGTSIVENTNTTAGRANGRTARPLKLTHYVPPHQTAICPRRFSAAFTFGCDTVAFHGGQGSQSRLASIDVLEREGSQPIVQPCPLAPPKARIGHTITSVHNSAALLVGGRASPTDALADCWLIKHGAWQQVHDLTPARFRHSSVRLKVPCGDSHVEGVMVCGGKASDGTVVDDWTLWTPTDGWRIIPVNGPRPPPRFGAAISCMGSAQNWGVLLGGIGPDGTAADEIWEWHVTAAPHLHLHFIHRTNNIQADAPNSIGRVGAHLLPFGDSLLLIGGVSKKEILSLSDDILVVSKAEDGTTICVDAPTISLSGLTWPLLVGTAAAAVSPNEVVLAGGGAVCFSMGSFWNEGYFTITDTAANSPPWTVSVSHSAKPENVEGHGALRNIDGRRTPIGPIPAAVPRIQLRSSEDFTKVLAESTPVIIQGQDIGPCTQLWTLDYLKEKIGADREVVVHECNSDRMTFQSKNFAYIKKYMGDFLDDISQGSKAYLRAASSTQPNKLPTKLEDDFPNIASDFRLPDVFDFVKAKYHSSPLRISGPVTLWLHYDVLANVLCQISGAKTLHIYPPWDVKYLSYSPGGSSSDIDVLASKDPKLRNTHPHIASLKPGDILFIPPMWSHTAMPEDGVSVAVNVFFRNLENGYAAGRDVYGNRDLQAYENGRRDVQRIVRAFRDVPEDVKGFYLERLAAELVEKR